MAKKQNKPIKTCADCIHEFACRGWTDGRRISDTSASQCPNHQTVKESGAYLCGVLDERKRKKTNADRIRSMSDEELAMCLYEIGYDRGWDEPKYALEWLQQPAEETDNEAVEEQKAVTGMAEYIEKWSIVNRLIDIENEFQQYKPFHGFEHAMYRKICEAEIAIGKTQAANVAPVVHGHWIIGVDNDDFDIKCSKCEWTDTFEVAGIAAVERIAKAMHYCQNCGARMDGGGKR